MGAARADTIIICVYVAVAVFNCAAQATTTTIPWSSSAFQVQRALLDNDNTSEPVISALTARTERVDPLDSFKKYRGGYNITNKHYWSSTIYTGKYGYIIAAIWLIVGFIFAVISLIKTVCFNKRRPPEGNKRTLCFKRYCLWPILLAILFTLLSLITSGVALGGSSRFHSRAESIRNTIIATTQEATGTIYNVTEAVRALNEDGGFEDYLQGSSSLISTSQKLSDDTDNIQSKAERTIRLVNKGLNILNVVTIVTIVINIIVVLALLGSAPLRLRRTIHMFIIISWLLTTLFWIYFGLYFFLNKFAADTCAALDEYRVDPRNSTLSSILPCTDQTSARSVLRYAGAGIHDFIDQVNANISRLHLSSLSDVQSICNPISGAPEYNYQPQNCSSSTIQIGDIPQILKGFTCSGGDNGTCEQGEFISAGDYSRVVLYTSSIQTILNSFPSMESLVNCQLVKDAFSTILFEDCKPLKKYVHMTWAALAAMSTIMVALVLAWTYGAHHDIRCHSSDGSVKPQLTPNTPELGLNRCASSKQVSSIHPEGPYSEP